MHTKFPIKMMVIGVVKGQAVREEHTMTLPFCPHGLRANEEADANADAGAYVETLQIIVVKPSWIDSIFDGGRACLPARFGSIS
ncbi:unnamed protein product [Hymenolepis diminuta]|uniref:RNase H domain-containing protein n=1 Tax=Hymenolepis diminuta TaxID=6216 RepID=A0A0R3SMJ0_HYMDI|nr:unnamed protein product [Hymenolepis diminuta]